MRGPREPSLATQPSVDYSTSVWQALVLGHSLDCGAHLDGTTCPDDVYSGCDRHQTTSAPSNLNGLDSNGSWSDDGLGRSLLSIMSALKRIENQLGGKDCLAWLCRFQVSFYHCKPLI